MSNNKQSSIEWLIEQLKEYDFSEEDDTYVIKIQSWVLTEKHEQAKAKYEHEMCVFADEYASYVLEQSKSGIKGAMVSMCAWTFFKNRRNEQQ